MYIIRQWLIYKDYLIQYIIIYIIILICQYRNYLDIFSIYFYTIYTITLSFIYLLYSIYSYMGGTQYNIFLILDTALIPLSLGFYGKRGLRG